ncbi:hypothetical protein HOB10_01495 [Candidatus Parcubacteria bacterium]|jgi:hypothetical protein|nr:hypothetical protein [Candidatus Parcubacteria bacterium]
MAKKKFDILFNGDDGAKKVGSAEATTAQGAVKEYCRRSGAAQLSCVCRRLTAKETEEK